MPYALQYATTRHPELGSGDRKHHDTAFVVNTKTGEHKSHNPIPIEKAEAQKRVLEGVAEHEEKLKPDSAVEKAPMTQAGAERKAKAEAIKAEKAKTEVEANAKAPMTQAGAERKAKMEARKAERAKAKAEADAKAEAEKPKKSSADTMLDEIKSMVAHALKLAKENPDIYAGAKFWNANISPKLDLYGAEYLGSGGASELGDEMYDDIQGVMDDRLAERKENKEKSKLKEERDTLRDKNNWNTVPSKEAKAWYITSVDDALKALLKIGLSEEKAKRIADSYRHELTGEKYLTMWKAPKSVMTRRNRIKSDWEKEMDRLEAQLGEDLKEGMFGGRKK